MLILQLRSDFIMKLEQCTKEELEVIELSLFAYYNFYRKRFEENHNADYRNEAIKRIRLVEKILEDIGVAL
jgi:hypothetical protein